ncbi:MAG: selenium metabolism-associated LysR family transcriptional regulator [Oscillospiraceae bacterium]
MNFRQLEAFISVIKYKSFSKAAEANFISQPTISIHINGLEEELETPLIIRSPKGIIPTQAGKIFYSYAMDIVKLRDKSILEIKKTSEKVSGLLDIAASTVPAQYVIPKMLQDLTNQYSNVFFSIKQLDSLKVIEKVESMEVEVGVCGTKVDKSNCNFIPFLEDELIVIAPNNKDYQQYKEILPECIIKKAPFISREKGSGTRAEMEQILNSLQIKKLNVISQMENTESIKQAVKSGLGISIISQLAAEDYIEFNNILSFRIDNLSMKRQFYIVTRKNRPLSRQAEVFIEYMKNNFK